MVTRRIAGLAPLLLALALAACGGEDGAPEAVREDSAGVEIVRHAGTDRPLEWSVERVALLGGASEGPESFTSVHAFGLDADTTGRLHVLDRDAFRIVVFDSALSVERTLGSEGEGPGELAGPSVLDVRPDGEVAVFDYARGGLVRWGRDGASLPMERPPLPFIASPMERTPRGLLLAMSVSASGSGGDRVRHLAFVQGGDTLAIAERSMGGGGRVRYESCGVGLPNTGPVLGPELVWSYSDGRDRVAVGEEVSYVVDLYEGPRKVRSVRRDVPPREVTEAMARRQLGDGMTIGVGGEQRTCATDEVIEQSGVASHLQTVDALRFGPDGRLWVVRGHLEDEEPEIDVFAPDGAYLGTLPAGTPEPLIFLPDGRLVAKTVDELDVERLAVYRMTEN